VEGEEEELAAEDAARFWCAGRLFAATSSHIFNIKIGTRFATTFQHHKKYAAK